ncbi:high mobility group protein B1-like [Molossus nigricans]
MSKGDPKRLRSKMSLYAFFVQTFWEERKKKHPDASVNSSEFFKKCSERWKTMSAKEKGKFEDMAKADKARYEREMKTKFKDLNAPKRPWPAFFFFCSEYHPKIKGKDPSLSIGGTAKNWEKGGITAADDKKGVVKAEKGKKKKKEEEDKEYREEEENEHDEDEENDNDE